MMRQAHRICSHSAKRLANDVVAEGSICGAARQPSRVSMTHPNFDSCRLQHARHVKPVPLRSWFQRTASTWHQINRPAVMSSMQGQVQQAGLEAAAEVLGKEVPRDSPAVDKALNPNSDFPEKPMGSKEQQDTTREFLGPAAAQTDMKNVDQMKEVPPVAGKRGQGDLKGDMVEGINRSVGDMLGSVGDTESGKKGTGGVDFSNAAGMGGV